MSIEEIQNFQTFQGSDSVEYPQNEKEVSHLIKKFYKSNMPIELVGTGSKKKNRKITPVRKNIKFIKIKWHCGIFTGRTLYQGKRLHAYKRNRKGTKKK